MSASANDAGDNLYANTKRAARDFRRRSGNVSDYASDEMRAFLADVEDLVKRVSGVSDNDVAQARARVEDAIGGVRETIGETTESLRERARYAVEATNDYVKERPWTVIGLAAAVGLVMGIGVTAAASRR